MTGRVTLAALAYGWALVSAPQAAAMQELEPAWTAYTTGRYEEAISQFNRLVRRHPVSSEAARGLVRALSEVGRYEDAEEAARQFIERNPESPELWNSLGEVLALRGHGDDAASAFTRSIRGSASDSLDARLNLAAVKYRRGETAKAMQEFDAFIDVYNSNPRRSSEELAAVATAVRYLGVDDPQLFKDALRAYDGAIAADSSNLEAQVALGELFLEKYQGTEARRTFDAVLERNPNHPRGLLGLARTRRFASSSSDALELTRRSIEVNRNYVAARVFLATLQIEAEVYDRALSEVGHALEINPTAPEALSVLAAIRYLQGDELGFEAATQRALALNPQDAELFNTLATVSARNRLYYQAVQFARRAVELDPKSWRAYGLLGMNQLRVGAVTEGREHLEIAFRGDPYDLWTKNTLDLLDTLEQYSETESARFRFFIDPKESDLLSLYASSLAEEAYDRLAERYGYRPTPPVRVEIYPDHVDFSVRTVGLVGIGALGVSFGPVLAMDSPSALEIGSFHWGSTLWHEIAHTFHLGMTNSRVPRWFAEGLAVFEEHHARPGWGDDVSPAFLAAYKTDRLLPVSELNNGFTRPAYPEQLGFSYYQASLVCEFIERDYGHDALTRMLLAYRDGKSTPDVFRTVLGTPITSFDEAFDRYLRERFVGPLAAVKPTQGTEEIAARAQRDPDDFVAQLAMGQALIRGGQRAEAIPYLERAKVLFPEYAGPASSYWHLAQIYREQGAVEEAAGELVALTRINAQHYGAFLELAELMQLLNDERGTADALDRALYVYPLDMAVHQRLAKVSARLGDWERAIRERRAILALDPVDRAEALYQLAVTYFNSGDRENARRTVIAALERAPNFEAAQDLLLQIHGERQEG